MTVKVAKEERLETS